MNHNALVDIAVVLVLGISAQWIAWRLNFPSILLLLLLGIVAGPVTGLLDADRLLGDLLIPLVSLSVGLILFEGGLSLNLRDIGGVTGVVRRLITVGALATFAIVSLAAWGVLGLAPSLAILYGAVLSVTGPTVIGPLLRQVRPRGQVGPILQWEGILIDPVGAMLAVLVFEAIIAGDFLSATSIALTRFLTIVVAGSATGAAGAGLLLLLMQRYLVPDFLRNAVTLSLVAGVFVLSDVLAAESGLFAVTVMGVLLANQRRVPLHDIVEFKENIRVLILAMLFILLASRLDLEDLALLDGRALTFLVILVLVARPAAVWLSTIKSSLTWRERAFIMGVAPRGIVAAAVSSIFALALEAAGEPGAAMLVPYTFAAIIATVTIYGLTARPYARLLGLASPAATAALIVGAHSWGRALASEIERAGGTVMLVDSNWSNVVAARRDGLATHFGSILDDEPETSIDMSGLGVLLALTANDAVNTLACTQFQPALGRGNVYRVQTRESRGEERAVEGEHRGRLLFETGLSVAEIERRVENGARIASMPVEGRTLGDSVMIVVRNGQLIPVTATSTPIAQAGDTIIGLT
jgi:NhaP-type Na+/H+ or K+/H+ antiporter